MLPKLVIENWQRLNQYFFVLNELVRTASPDIFNEMVAKGVVTKMLDFVLENESPLVKSGLRPYISNTMGNYASKPDLTNFVLALAHILERYP
jgi:hypothetical protein